MWQWLWRWTSNNLIRVKLFLYGSNLLEPKLLYGLEMALWSCDDGLLNWFSFDLHFGIVAYLAVSLDVLWIVCWIDVDFTLIQPTSNGFRTMNLSGFWCYIGYQLSTSFGLHDIDWIWWPRIPMTWQHLMSWSNCSTCSFGYKLTGDARFLELIVLMSATNHNNLV